MSISLDENQLSGQTKKRGEVLVKVEGVSKIFCRDLKKSLLYGLQDSVKDIFSWGAHKDQQERPLRKGEFWANKDISFELRKGDCFGLIGHNGAGKTTLLKMLNGLIKPDNGRIEMRGKVAALIALGAGFNPILTGRENIYINGSVLGLTRAEIHDKMDEIIDFAEIGDFLDSPVQNYSSGMQVRLGFAIAIAIKPDILLLDEVLAVGDVAFQAKCFNKLADLRREGVPFILVSHNMHQISRYCDKVVFLKRGHIEFVGDVAEGIRLFLLDSGESENQPQSQPNWAITHGSGKVRLTGAKFIDENDRAVEEAASGSPITLVVYFERGEENVAEAVLDLTVICNGELLYQSTNQNNGAVFENFPARGEIRVKFNALPLNKGPLEFNFCLLSEKTSELFDWKRGLRLKVKPNNRQTGLVSIDTEWHVKAR